MGKRSIKKEAPDLSRLKRSRPSRVPAQRPSIPGQIQFQGTGEDLNHPQFQAMLRNAGVEPEEFFYTKRKMPQSSPEEVMQFIQKRKATPKGMEALKMLRQQKKSLSGQGSSDIVPPPQNMMRREGKRRMDKKIQITEGQLKEAIKKAIIIHEKKKMVKKIVTEELQGQLKIRNLCESLLTEGPLTGVWQGMKQGAGSFGRGIKQAFGGAGQAFAQGQAEEQARKQAEQAQQAAQKQLQTAMQAVSKAKQKYNQEILKSAEVLNGYHDSVVNLFGTLQNVADSLGPASEQLSQDVMNTVGQLKSDLNSEKGQIDAFMKQLSKDLPNVDVGSLGSAATRAQKQRWDKESEESGRSSAGRAAAMSRPQNVDFSQQHQTANPLMRQLSNQDIERGSGQGPAVGGPALRKKGQQKGKSESKNGKKSK